MNKNRLINKVKEISTLQKKYNLFTSINKNIEQQLCLNNAQNKQLSGLLGAIKDNIVTKDFDTTCASEILKGYKSPFDSTVVSILKNNGATILGKTNLDEFGMGSAGFNSVYGPTLNPIYPNEKRVAGGSSSGSAAAVSCDLADFSLGTDTGGSVRLPASYTHVLGFKPSYGRISRYGVVAYAQSLDTVGILAKDINILDKIFRLLDKFDQKDPTSLSNELRTKIEEKNADSEKQIKIGLVNELKQESVPDLFHDVLLDVLRKLHKRRMSVFSVSIPSVKYSLPIYYTLAPAEAASNLSRYDGIRYGKRDKDSDLCDDTLFAPTRAEFGEEVKNRIILGNHNLCSDSFKNNYLKAQQLRVQLIDEFDSIFRSYNVLTKNKNNFEKGVDFLICLTAMNKAPKLTDVLSKYKQSSLKSYINDVFTVPMSLAGLPTISVPIKNTEVSIQIVGQYGDDYKVLEMAKTIMSL
ncbi:glutamyl-tRNA(Gln) amidotransferase subunit HER2 SCDLUD_004856 [Saccharomycodes ludwigii]|uniref:glutamyl-tRNA(Gln) amidotransferase subunit HER2 n=1 Tax=Saccharomycodes ludwigii TaxID=36035 RepID=UPI001E84D435|nr:hypothetical protein SCDLUD_004856 [Saccharomycodes ludwigii]KAH3899413.1 hypothetical protein SCDLUD_004856 [Saccharomycodes ludwigii]